jgi:hypothetical protein
MVRTFGGGGGGVTEAAASSSFAGFAGTFGRRDAQAFTITRREDEGGEERDVHESESEMDTDSLAMPRFAPTFATCREEGGR